MGDGGDAAGWWLGWLTGGAACSEGRQAAAGELGMGMSSAGCLATLGWRGVPLFWSGWSSV